jgi:leader peptidase (prepilin peptidase)/N-methyltransferase
MAFLLFLFGLCVGSFLNVVIERLPRGEDIVRGRSRCPQCGHELAGRDLIPLLSFALLRGRCRYCREPISVQYPLVELVTGALFAVGGVSMCQCVNVSTLISALPFILYSSFLIPVFAIDLKHGIIPDRIVFPAIALVGGFRVIGVIWGIGEMWGKLRNDVGGLGPYLLNTDFFRHHAWFELRPFLFTLVGSFILYSFFFILHSLFRGRALGGGDVKLAFLVGLITGFPSMIVAVFSAFLTGAIISVILMMLGKKKFGETIPFGPFLVIGTYVALFWGDDIINWYLRLLQ